MLDNALAGGVGSNDRARARRVRIAYRMVWQYADPQSNKILRLQTIDDRSQAVVATMRSLWSYPQGPDR